MNDEVKKFWDQQADLHGTSDMATAPDHYYRELEIAKIIEHLIIGERVLDAGCGNGYSTIRFFETVRDLSVVGLDYSDRMIEQARIAAGKLPIPFVCTDVRTMHADLDDVALRNFDTIISQRCLINLASWDHQKHALLEMKKCLKPNGRIILVENFVDGLARLNAIRFEHELPPISVRWHNRYLRMPEFIEFTDENFYVEYCENIGNMYYLVSRVVYAALAKLSGGEPQYDHDINRIAAKLPTLGDYYENSPNYLMVLRRDQ